MSVITFIYFPRIFVWCYHDDTEINYVALDELPRIQVPKIKILGSGDEVYKLKRVVGPNRRHSF